MAVEREREIASFRMSWQQASTLRILRILFSNIHLNACFLFFNGGVGSLSEFGFYLWSTSDLPWTLWILFCFILFFRGSRRPVRTTRWFLVGYGFLLGTSLTKVYPSGIPWKERVVNIKGSNRFYRAQHCTVQQCLVPICCRFGATCGGWSDTQPKGANIPPLASALKATFSFRNLGGGFKHLQAWFCCLQSHDANLVEDAQQPQVSRPEPGMTWAWPGALLMSSANPMTYHDLPLALCAGK